MGVVQPNVPDDVLKDMDDEKKRGFFEYCKICKSKPIGFQWVCVGALMALMFFEGLFIGSLLNG